MRIGILALQGAFAEHGNLLGQLGIEHFLIRSKQDLEQEHDGMIIPGGESTVMAKLLRDLQLFGMMKAEIEQGMPVFGTCAGLILLAAKLEGEAASGFGTMDITAKRNAYGRQLGSFQADADFGGRGEIPMVFIRAPYIVKAGEAVDVLAEVDGHIVAAVQGNQLATAFHPELTRDLTVHRYFADMIEKRG